MNVSLSVGDLTVHWIPEVSLRHRQVFDMLPDLGADQLAGNRDWLRQPLSLDADDWLHLSFHAWLVRTPHHTILVDSCLGNDKPRARPDWNMRSDDAFLRNLAAAGVGPEDIDYVMCTHLHVDHVGWNTRRVNGEWVPTFPNARYVFARREHDWWESSGLQEERPEYEDSVLPIVRAGRALLADDDFQLGDHVRILPTPGHTPGHVAFCFGRGRDDLVMSGDLMHVPLQTRYPEQSIRLDADRLQAAATRRAFLERYCDTPTVCCTAHFPLPSAGHIRRWGEGFRFEYLKVAG